MRIPYVPDPPLTANDQETAILERIKARRGHLGLGAVDRALLHAPAVADGWNSLIGTLRTGTSLPDSIRELAICRIAALNRAEHEWGWHFPLLQAALPSIHAQFVDYVRNAAPLSAIPITGAGGEKLRQVLRQKINASQNGTEFDDRHVATLAYVDSITEAVDVPDEVFALVRESFENKEIIELTATVAMYNGVSRFLVALDVGEDTWDSNRYKVGI